MYGTPKLDKRQIFTPDHSALYVSVPKTGRTTIKTVMAATAGMIDPTNRPNPSDWMRGRAFCLRGVGGFVYSTP